MKDEQHSTNNNKEVYVYLDLNGKVSNEFLNSKIYIQVANLHKPDPLVQVNDVLFKGNFSHSVGTNLFFEETQTKIPVFPYVRECPISLKPLLMQTKTLTCKAVKIPPRQAIIPDDNKNFEYNWSLSYNELLQRFEDGCLQLEDIVKKSTKPEEQHSELNVDEGMKKNSPVQEIESMDIELLGNNKYSTDKNTFEKLEHSVMHVDHTEGSIQLRDEEISEIESEYESLVKLAKRPVKRASCLELPAHCASVFKSNYEFESIQCKILYAPYNSHMQLTKDLTEEQISNYVDIDRCVLYGIIPSSKELPRILTEQEKKNVLILSNFENLALPARYYVLKKYLNQLEQCVNNLSREELEDKDDFGRSPLETLTIYQRLCKALESRIAEIVSANENLPSVVNVNVDNNMYNNENVT